MEITLTRESVEARRQRIVTPDRVLFRITALYGICRAGLTLPIGRAGSIHSGPVALTGDPEADPSCNLGVIDFAANKLKIRYGAQAVFPALYDLVASGNHDPSLLNPPRLTATDDCTITPDLTGWRALGCLDFLPGSIWSGATGG
jgi:hypothetical protein